ncbi:competence protein ComG, partial [Clostridioides difficile]|nr:competence protein ComG [Clostridioides difficile]
MSPYIINSFQQNSCIKQSNFDNLNLSNKKES